MKTVMIYDQCGQDDIKFAVLDGDYSHLNGAYINSTETSDDVAEELSDLLYDPESGNNRVELLEHFPIDAVKNGAIVIVAGFLP